jgi:hypothetical protein
MGMQFSGCDLVDVEIEDGSGSVVTGVEDVISAGRWWRSGKFDLERNG